MCQRFQHDKNIMTPFWASLIRWVCGELPYYHTFSRPGALSGWPRRATGITAVTNIGSVHVRGEFGHTSQTPCRLAPDPPPHSTGRLETPARLLQYYREAEEALGAREQWWLQYNLTATATLDVCASAILVPTTAEEHARWHVP